MSKGEAGMGYCPFPALSRDPDLGSQQAGCQVRRGRVAVRSVASATKPMCAHDMGATRARPGLALRVSRRGIKVMTWTLGCGHVQCRNTIFGS